MIKHFIINSPRFLQFITYHADVRWLITSTTIAAKIDVPYTRRAAVDLCCDLRILNPPERRIRFNTLNRTFRGPTPRGLSANSLRFRSQSVSSEHHDVLSTLPMRDNVFIRSLLSGAFCKEMRGRYKLDAKVRFLLLVAAFCRRSIHNPLSHW